MTSADSAAGAADSPNTRSIRDDDAGTADVISDPAKDDTDGQDWSDEGGATPSGPATAAATATS